MLINKGDQVYIVDNGEEVKSVSVVVAKCPCYVVKDNNDNVRIATTQDLFFTEEQAKNSIGGAQ